MMNMHDTAKVPRWKTSRTNERDSDVMGAKTIDIYRCLLLSRMLGCSAIAVDLYGEDTFPSKLRDDRSNINAAFDAMNDLLADPVYLRKLMRAYITESVKQLNGDPARVGAVGFCFGGSCVLEVSLPLHLYPRKLTTFVKLIADPRWRPVESGSLDARVRIARSGPAHFSLTT
jgi:Dienelactone hydrolase family